MLVHVWMVVHVSACANGCINPRSPSRNRIAKVDRLMFKFLHQSSRHFTAIRSLIKNKKISKKKKNERMMNFFSHFLNSCVFFPNSPGKWWNIHSTNFVVRHFILFLFFFYRFTRPFLSPDVMLCCCYHLSVEVVSNIFK